MSFNVWNILGITSWQRVTWPWEFLIEPGLRGVILVLSDSSKLPSLLSFFEADPRPPPWLFISSQNFHHSFCFLELLSHFSKIGCKGKHSPQLSCFLVIPQNHHMGLVFFLEVTTKHSRERKMGSNKSNKMGKVQRPQSLYYAGF